MKVITYILRTVLKQRNKNCIPPLLGGDRALPIMHIPLDNDRKHFQNLFSTSLYQFSNNITSTSDPQPSCRGTLVFRTILLNVTRNIVTTHIYMCVCGRSNDKKNENIDYYFLSFSTEKYD